MGKLISDGPATNQNAVTGNHQIAGHLRHCHTAGRRIVSKVLCGLASHGHGNGRGQLVTVIGNQGTSCRLADGDIVGALIGHVTELRLHCKGLDTGNAFRCHNHVSCHMFQKEEAGLLVVGILICQQILPTHGHLNGGREAIPLFWCQSEGQGLPCFHGLRHIGRQAGEVCRHLICLHKAILLNGYPLCGHHYLIPNVGIIRVINADAVRSHRQIQIMILIIGMITGHLEGFQASYHNLLASGRGTS